MKETNDKVEIGTQKKGVLSDFPHTHTHTHTHKHRAEQKY